VSERLDEERLEVLRRWGVGLSADGREELRAAGKAIMLLVDEIDRLQVDVWHARARDEDGEVVPVVPEQALAEPAGTGEPSELSATLRDRLGAVLPSLNARNDP
jgi:hypothetical protein